MNEQKQNNTVRKNSENESGKVLVIGLGRAGIRIINQLNTPGRMERLELAAVDTDKRDTELSRVDSFIIGEEWTNGRGCGGNVIKGERAVAHKSNTQIRNIIKDVSLLIIVAGFGRGTGTGGAPVIARIAREKNVPTIIIATLPFTFEGHGKREIAEKQISALIKTTNTVIPVPNDLLYSRLPSTASFEEAFKLSNKYISKAVIGITELLHYDNMLSVDLCALHNILCNQKTECGIGIGQDTSADNNSRIRNALKNLFDSPLMGGQPRLKTADAIIMSVTGGEDLTIGEVKYALETITSIADKDAEIIAGANTNTEFNNKVQITVLPIKSENSVKPSAEFPNKIHLAKQASKTAIIRDVHKLKEEAIQLELPFKTQNRGIFTNTTPTIHKGEDLDIPTFQRKDIHVDTG
ncbi:MAG: cell division FtsZ family protein [Victivallales bacterium]|nr:cell division FtsZ family protein [Victivallales bacterium]